MNAFNIRQWITITGSTNGQEAQKRGKEAYTRSPTLIYTTSCKEDKGERNHQGELPVDPCGPRIFMWTQFLSGPRLVF
jgi:hypothetical protein